MCTEGKNVATEMKCTSLLPLDEIVRVVTNLDCIPEVCGWWWVRRGWEQGGGREREEGRGGEEGGGGKGEGGRERGRGGGRGKEGGR